MKRLLPSGSHVEFVQWQSKATEKWHEGEPLSIARAKRIRVRWETETGRSGYFTLNYPFPGRGPTEARLRRLAGLLQGNIDYYVGLAKK
jgi:hypothetical protein